MILSFMLLILMLMMVASSWSDFRFLRIPNKYVVIIFVTFIASYASAPDVFGKWWEHLGGAVLFFVLTYLMFAVGMLGAGDSKYGTALALWVGLHGLVAYIFFMAVAGGALGLFALYVQRRKPFKNKNLGKWIEVLQQEKSAIPYGIALSFGAGAGLFHTGILDHALVEVFKIIS